MPGKLKCYKVFKKYGRWRDCGKVGLDNATEIDVNNGNDSSVSNTDAAIVAVTYTGDYDETAGEATTKFNDIDPAPRLLNLFHAQLN